MVSGKTPLPAGMRGLLVWGLLLSIPFAQPLEATQAEEQKSAAKVIIDAVDATPGDPIDIPLLLFGKGPLRIGTVVIEISFPKSALSFVRADPGLGSMMAEAEVRATQKEASGDPDVSLLEVTVAAKEALKPGTLAYLKFRVSTEAPLGTLRLELKETKATTVEGEPLQMAKGNDGEITLLEEQILPHISCFFFTH